MNSPRTRARRERAPELLAPYPRRSPLSASLRESAAIAGGFLVLLITAWLIWGAFAEAASALAESG
jgi:hypothetical protein